MMPNLGQQPIMEYVRNLESMVRTYQAEGVRIGRMVWWWGFVTGALAASAFFWLVVRLIARKG